MVFLEQAADQFLKIGRHFILVVDEVVVLVEVIGIVKRSGGKFQIHGPAKLEKPEHVLGIAIGNRDSKTNVLHAHGLEAKQGLQAPVKAFIPTAQGIVGLRQPLDADPHTNVRKPLGHFENFLIVVARSGNDNTLGLLEHDLHDVFQVIPEKRLAACNVGELELRKQLQFLGLDFLGGIGRVMPYVAHLAFHLAAVGSDDGDVGGGEGGGFHIYSLYNNSITFYLLG